MHKLVLIFSTGFLALSVFGSGVYAQVLINEAAAVNYQDVKDEDGDYPDWIELYNAGNEAVNLDGYGISDDPDDLFQWELPELVLDAGAYYLLYASGKDRVGYKAFFETVVREGDSTKYITPNLSVSSSWIDPEFDDSNWQKGPFGIGYGDYDDATQVSNGTLSVFTRTSFTVDDAEDVRHILFHIDYDDGYIAYLNGLEVSRANIAGESPLPFNATSITYTEPLLFQGQDLTAIEISDFTDNLTTGENILAIQLHNSSRISSDLTLIPFLSLGYGLEPFSSMGVAAETGLQEKEVVYPHLSFQLSSSGESIYLTKPDLSFTDSMVFPELKAGESYGRSPQDRSDFYIFTEPTPLQENTGEGFLNRLPDPELSLPGGFYEDGIDLSLADIGNPEDIYFTTDGSDPTTDSQKFGEYSRAIRNTTTLKLRAFSEGKLPSEIVTKTYFIGEQHDLPVIALSTDPQNFFDSETGIYVVGENGAPGNCIELAGYSTANWNQVWERPLFIEFYEMDGNIGFTSGAGVKIFGGCSRLNPQKSLAIYFRGEYGNPELNYRLFEEKEIETFESFVLRNSGNDFTSENHSMFRDGLMTTLMEDAEVEYQAFQPAVVYLNGEYWGIHNIREKVNEHFIESNSSAGADNIDLLEANKEVIHGTAENYNELLSAIEKADMQNEAEYRAVESMIDIDSYIDYMAAQIYYANTDWPGNNIKYWRDRASNTGWRWILYDTDFGFDLSYNGVYDYSGLMYRYNMFDFLLTTETKGWANQAWSTLLLRRIIESEVFVHKFVNRTSDLLNTVFDPEYVHHVIDSLSQKIESEIPRHIDRWGNSTQAWEYDVRRIHNFANGRPSRIKDHFRQKFGLSAQATISVNVSDREKGNVRVNRVIAKEYPWSGEYFGGVPVEITALPKSGYKFTGWSGSLTSTQRTITVDPADELGLTANFETLASSSTDIVINEIMYNAEGSNDPGDWFELHNISGSALNLSGWTVKDEENAHSFILPDGTVIESQAYLVIVEDSIMFEAVYPGVRSFLGRTGFGLNGNGDQVRVFDHTGVLVDSVEYSDSAPWTEVADGKGYTLELTDPSLDNSEATSWEASAVLGGSPGSKNGTTVSIENTMEIPTHLGLEQNYPNPFNPSTTISFDIPENSFVKLSIYDLLGREVSVLYNGKLSAGSYQSKWNAGAFASGVYIYQLKVGSISITRKMVLTK